MYNPEFITFTGADDRTSLSEMKSLAASYPVEFAILFSKSRAGKPRYPSRGWIEQAQTSGLRLAAHICGEWAKQIVQTGASDLDHALQGFDRAQINTSAPVDHDLILTWADRVERSSGQKIEPILQCRGDFPDESRISWLYDCSGGRGVLPEAWPTPPKDGIRFGYAGGMGPDNIDTVLRDLSGAEGGWIDMESRVRNDRDEFDLDMCRAVCEAAFGHVTPEVLL
ncbi:hypothetical protein KUV57_12270 [Epibacterium sp. DP7N7-1]|nr:hypothetical protein [Epibacterium sp. DP7N7-1]